MLIGLVQWFDNKKGFGIARTPEEGEFFLHIKNFITPPPSISLATSIVFESRFNYKKNRNEAINCHLVGEPEDWKVIQAFLGEEDEVSIEYGSFSLMDASTKQFFKGKSIIEIKAIITDYFDHDLDRKYFITYCELIEKRISEDFDAEKSNTLLKEIYTYFGNHKNEELLFYTWKSKKFRFIGYDEYNDCDYEIPVKVLKSFTNEIGVPELKRISQYKSCSGYLNDIMSLKFSKINDLTEADLKSLYPLVELLNEKEHDKYKLLLDKKSSELTINKITEISNRTGIIKSQNDIDNLSKLKRFIPNQISVEKKDIIESEVNKIIASKCSEELMSELWYRGISDNVSYDQIEKLFLAKETNDNKKMTILTKLQLEQQLEILKIYANKNNSVKSFELLEEAFKKENLFNNDFKLSDKIFDDEFLKGKKLQKLVSLFNQYLNDNTSEEERYLMFFQGLIKDIPKNIVKEKISELGKSECEKVFLNQAEDKSFIKEILLAKISRNNVSEIEWIYEFAKKFLDTDGYKEFDQKVFDTIEENKYFKFWEKGIANIPPTDQINVFLNEKYEVYNVIDIWILNEIITKEEIASLLLTYIIEQAPVKDRITFLKQLNHIKYLLQLDENYIKEINQINNDFYKLILWYLEKDKILNFNLLKSKFIYFPPEDQIKIIRKLFHLKSINEFELTVEKLNELTRPDLDLQRISLKYHPSILLDLSTDVIIKALLSYNKNQKFLVESKLLEVVIKNLGEHKSRRFKIEEYFEECQGRQIAKFSVTKNGEIEKINFGNNQFYFALSFSTGETFESKSRRGRRKEFIPNPNFENLKEAVKKLPKSKWNVLKKHWGVPSRYEDEVLNFARENQFYINFESKKYENKVTLKELKRVKKPSGIKFCEGFLSNKPDKYLKKNFWWCSGLPCFENCETIHTPEDWENYTLLDFCKILNLNTDETLKGDLIPNGKYYQFIHLINRFNLLLDKLYCAACNEILYPVKIAEYAQYNVTRFSCSNNSCPKYGEEIYLNHCWNKKCRAIVDSRESKNCPNGWFICKECGCCCSNQEFMKRLKLKKAFRQFISKNLEKSVEDKIGHYEKSQYYCYKCGHLKQDKNYCNNCDSNDNLDPFDDFLNDDELF